jgi:hypothetical protein
MTRLLTTIKTNRLCYEIRAAGRVRVGFYSVRAVPCASTQALRSAFASPHSVTNTTARKSPRPSLRDPNLTLRQTTSATYPPPAASLQEAHGTASFCFAQLSSSLRREQYNPKSGDRAVRFQQRIWLACRRWRGCPVANVRVRGKIQCSWK